MKTRFHQLVDTIAAELARPSDPATLLAAYAELLQFGENPPAIILARNTLRQQQLEAARLAAEAEAQRVRDEAECVRREAVAAQHRVVQQLRLDFNQALADKNLDQAKFLADSFHQAALQAGLLEAVGGFEERGLFFASVAEKIENLEEVAAQEAEAQEEQDALKARAKLALVGPAATNGHVPRTICREGKTAKDHASGAWKRHQQNVAARPSVNKGKGGKKNKK